jgi:SbmA/BacA-like family
MKRSPAMMETSPKLKEGDERAVEIPPDAKSITSTGCDDVHRLIPILAGLSDRVILPHASAVPYSLVWLACAMLLGGMPVSWFVGAKLPGSDTIIKRLKGSLSQRAHFYSIILAGTNQGMLKQRAFTPEDHP